MKKLKQLLFPLWASKSILLTDDMKEEIAKFGEENVDFVYYLKTGRHLLPDQIVAAFMYSLLLILGLISISFLFS